MVKTKIIKVDLNFTNEAAPNPDEINLATPAPEVEVKKPIKRAPKKQLDVVEAPPVEVAEEIQPIEVAEEVEIVERAEIVVKGEVIEFVPGVEVYEEVDEVWIEFVLDRDDVIYIVQNQVNTNNSLKFFIFHKIFSFAIENLYLTSCT